MNLIPSLSNIAENRGGIGTGAKDEGGGRGRATTRRGAHGRRASPLLQRNVKTQSDGDAAPDVRVRTRLYVDLQSNVPATDFFRSSLPFSAAKVTVTESGGVAKVNWKERKKRKKLKYLKNLENLGKIEKKKIV